MIDRTWEGETEERITGEVSEASGVPEKGMTGTAGPRPGDPGPGRAPAAADPASAPHNASPARSPSDRPPNRGRSCLSRNAPLPQPTGRGYQRKAELRRL